MRFPSLSRREEPAPAVAGNEADGTGAVATDTRPGTRPATGEKTVGGKTDRGAATERAAVARAATARSSVDGSRRARAAAPTPEPALDRGRTVDRDRDADADRTADRDRERERDRIVTGDGTVDRDATVDRDSAPDTPPVPAGPRPRASLLATLGLILGVAGILFVLTGTLAGYGIGLGAAGAVLAVLGLIVTRRRHVAGKPDALLGIAFGLGAVVLGVLAMTGQYDWPTTDGDTVARLREWLDSQFVDRI
ncbi:thrombospondin [Micromonospora craterilacus]|uniref:Thrombospondin n=1 Tax=Micromonospora craterilacus TaxID=1655439 RepID=A0A2W2E922_9ACTN|nr:thrombospondin [Micromonospora craterilacus]PZG13229.1 thrombospondin [Micromonospora craterilacus]